MLPLLIALGVSAGVSTTLTAGLWVEHKNAEARDAREDPSRKNDPGPNPSLFCAEADGKMVRVYTPHIGMMNPYNRDVMNTPGSGAKWLLVGYEDRNEEEVAVWESESFRDSFQIAALINAQHYLKQNQERLYVFDQWTDEDIHLAEFVDSIWEEGNW